MVSLPYRFFQEDFLIQAVTPILGAIIADQYLGKYNTILIFCVVYMVGLLILTTTSLPTSLEHGAGLGGFIVAVLTIGLGTGGIKSNVAPLIADQYKRRQMAIGHDKKTGERIIIDPAITIQRIYMVFYFCINVGCLALLATPYMERDLSYWSAYLLCLCVFMCGTLTLVLGRKVYIVRPPQGSVITDAFKAIWMMIKGRDMNAAKPTHQAALGKNITHGWDDHFVDEVKRALVACKVFCFYPIYWVGPCFPDNFVYLGLTRLGCIRTILQQLHFPSRADGGSRYPERSHAELRPHRYHRLPAYTRSVPVPMAAQEEYQLPAD
jgi:POT family proton-dependent oligopeptide transporter